MKRSGMQVMAKLVGMVKPLTGYMLIAVVMGVIGNLCATMITVLGAYAVTSFLGFTLPLSTTLLAALLLLCAVLRGALRYGEQTCNHYIAFKLLAIIRDRVFSALRRLAPAKLEGKDKGDLIAVITADIELLEVFYAHTISPILIATIFSGIMCGWIGHYHWLLGLMALVAYGIVGIGIPLLISHKSGDKGLAFREKSGALSGYVLDSMRGLNETLQYNDGSHRMQEMQQASIALSKDDESIKRNAGIGSAFVGMLLMIFDFIMLFISGLLYNKGIIGFDGVVIATVALMSSFGPVVSLSDLGSTLQYTFAAGNRVLDILEETPVVEEITDQLAPAFTGAAAKDIRFGYEDQDILKDLSLTIPKGKIIGIMGKSGCGKSTLLKLLMRFWQVDRGEITISNHNINTINTAALREAESYMTQDSHLFKDTIRNNLRIAKQDASQAQIEEACRKASLHAFIMTLPKGYDTEITELGDNLSGGERQRIGLARAFLHDAPFLLLDEPTSNLDSLNEGVILKSLYSEHQDQTILLVSHRKSTMNIADQVYTISNGRLSG